MRPHDDARTRRAVLRAVAILVVALVVTCWAIGCARSRAYRAIYGTAP